MNKAEAEKEEARWMAESDARTLAEADRIKKDQKRMKAAIGAADDLKKRAEDEIKELDRISKPENQKWVPKEK